MSNTPADEASFHEHSSGGWSIAERERIVAVMTHLIDEHVRYMRAAGKARSTIRFRERLLRRVDKEFPSGLLHASTPELEEWLGCKREPDWSPATRAVYYAHLHAFYQWLCRGRDPYLDFDPTDDMGRPRFPVGLPRPVTTAVVEDVLARAVRPYRTAVILSAFAGMRASEVAGTDREDLTGDEIRIFGKGSKTRAVPNHDMIRAELEHLPPGRVLVYSTGQPVGVDYAASWVSKYLTSIGHPDVTLHRFRHWYGTTLVRNGVDVSVVRVLMGHANLAMTARYVEVSGEQRRLAVNTLPTLRAGTR